MCDAPSGWLDGCECRPPDGDGRGKTDPCRPIDDHQASAPRSRRSQSDPNPGLRDPCRSPDGQRNRRAASDDWRTRISDPGAGV
jgi:hypothetical protein